MTPYRKCWRDALFRTDDLLCKTSETVVCLDSIMNANTLMSRGLRRTKTTACVNDGMKVCLPLSKAAGISRSDLAANGSASYRLCNNALCSRGSGSTLLLNIIDNDFREEC
jgi:hypothetical protein